jgi:hypothetical protein
MDEHEWLTSNQPRAMLTFLDDKISNRKLRLFACACCRRIWHLLPAEENRQAVAAVERFPDVTFEHPELHRALCASSTREAECADDDAYWAVKYLGRTYYKVTPAFGAGYVAGKVAHRAIRESGLEPYEQEGPGPEEAAQAALVREIAGNPFRPLRARALPGQVVALARECYETLPAIGDCFSILADALADLGEEEAAAHCRQGGHVKGCHVLDWALGWQ